MATGIGAFSVDSEAFAREGYLVFDPEIPEEILEGAVSDAERQFPSRFGWLPIRRTAGLPDLGRFTDAWRRSENVRRIALAPVTLRVLRDLYRREPRPFQTLNFRFGTQQLAHSDAVHFNTEPRGLMCGVWVALEDVDMDNGPLV